MNIQCKPFLALDVLALYNILQLRSEVFVVEQSCIYQDIDGKDILPNVHHLLITEANKLLGYARLLPKGVSYSDVSIGRILIAHEARGMGLGEKLVAHCLAQCQALWPAEPITIGAQSYLSTMYQKFGFIEVSEHYHEDGILHVDMTTTQPKYEEFL